MFPNQVRLLDDKVIYHYKYDACILFYQVQGSSRIQRDLRGSEYLVRECCEAQDRL